MRQWIRRQAIIWTNAGLLSIGPLVKLRSKYKLFIHKNAYENIFREIATILSGDKR